MVSVSSWFPGVVAEGVAAGFLLSVACGLSGEVVLGCCPGIGSVLDLAVSWSFMFSSLSAGALGLLLLFAVAFAFALPFGLGTLLPVELSGDFLLPVVLSGDFLLPVELSADFLLPVELSGDFLLPAELSGDFLLAAELFADFLLDGGLGFEVSASGAPRCGVSLASLNSLDKFRCMDLALDFLTSAGTESTVCGRRSAFLTAVSMPAGVCSSSCIGSSSVFS